MFIFMKCYCAQIWNCSKMKPPHHGPNTGSLSQRSVWLKTCKSPSPGSLKLDRAADLNPSAQEYLYKGQLILVEAYHSFLLSGGRDYVFKLSFLHWDKTSQHSKKHPKRTSNCPRTQAWGMSQTWTKAEYLHCNVWKLPICRTLFLRVEKYCGFLSHCLLNLEAIQKYHSSMSKAGKQELTLTKPQSALNLCLRSFPWNGSSKEKCILLNSQRHLVSVLAWAEETTSCKISSNSD